MKKKVHVFFLFLLLAFLTVPSAWAAYNDAYVYNNGEALVALCTGTNGIYVPESASDVKTFYIYDDGGADGNYSNNCSGKSTIHAPEGYGIKVWGWVKAESADYLHITNTLPASFEELIANVYGSGVTSQQSFGPYYSTGDIMTISFITDGNAVGPGFELRVELVPLRTARANGDQIRFHNPYGGGYEYITSTTGWSGVEATYSEGMTALFSFNPGYNTDGIWGLKVEKTDRTGIVGCKKNPNTGKYEFVMPSSDVYVSVKQGGDGFNLFNEEKSLSIAGSKTFKVYDEGGPEDSYANNFDGWLKLSAHEGFHFEVTGTVETEPSSTGTLDYLEIYDGEVAKGTSATPICKVYTPKGSSSTKVDVPSNCVSTGVYMTIHFHTDASNVASGLDLTVSSVGDIHSVKVFNTDPNGSISSDVSSAGTHSTVTLTAKPNSGYVLKSVSVVNKATGKSVYTNGDWKTNIVTFSMPAADVEVTPTFVTDTYSIAKNSVTGGYVSGISTAKVGTTVTLTANPSSGYLYNGVSVVGTNGNPITVIGEKGFLDRNFSFIMPIGDVTVTPSFTSDWSAEGGLFINMPTTGKVNATIPTGVQSFKVYDDGGKSGGYSNGGSGTLVLTAPSGYVLKLSGNVDLFEYYGINDDYLTVCDGADTSSTKLVDKLGRSSSVDHVYSSGQKMTLYFHSDSSMYASGLNLTVTLVSIDRQIAYENKNNGGSVTSNSPTNANIGSVVTYAYSYTSGYLVSNIEAVAEDGFAVKTSGGWYTGKTVSFAMPPSNVTIKSTYTNDWSAEGGLYINMPVTGLVNATIPEGVKSFKIYDDGGGTGNYSKGSNGTLVLTAPTGYFFELTGEIRTGYTDHTDSYTCNANDNLSVYDGSSTAATALLSNAIGCSTSQGDINRSLKIPSRGNTMTLNFKSDGMGEASFGLNLTVKLRKLVPELADDGNGGKFVNMITNHKAMLTIPASVKSFKVYDDGGLDSNYWKNVNDTLVLTAPTGYVLELNGNIKTGAAEKYFFADTFICNADDNLSVYDGASPSATALLLNKTSDCSTSSGPSLTSLGGPIMSRANTMTLVFKSSEMGLTSAGLDLTVKLIRVVNQITYTNNTPGGSVTSESPTVGKFDSTVNYAYSYNSGYMVSEITAVSAEGDSVTVTGGWYNAKKAFFKMPRCDVGVKSSYTNDWSAEGGLYINMPKASKVNAVIPEGVKSFKVYDDGGKDGKFSVGKNDTLVLRAPAGYVMQLSGSMTATMYDTLFVYSGRIGHATTLIGKYVGSSYGGVKTISDKVLSSGVYMTLLFNSNGSSISYAGLDLTVTLVKIELEPENDGESNYVNMVYQHKATFEIPDTIQSFKVYDDGGKDGNYTGNNRDTLVLKAPAGYILQLSGNVTTRGSSHDSLRVYTGERAFADSLLGKYKSSTIGSAVSISGKVLSTGSTMMLLFHSDDGYNYAGLDLTVTLIKLELEPKNDGLFYYVDMVYQHKATFEIPDSVSLFHVYDEGGRRGNYNGYNRDTLVLRAPAGYVLQLTGSVNTSTSGDSLRIYNGAGVNADSLLGTYKSSTIGDAYSISENILSSGRALTLLFHSYEFGDFPGIILTVSLVPLDYAIQVNGTANGRMEASKTENLHVGDAVYLLAEPNNGYMLKDVVAKDLSGNTAKISQYSFAVSELIMPAKNLVITPTFTKNLTAAGGLHLDMRKNRNFDASIPENVKSFKVYDNGGRGDAYESNSDDTLTLTAPEGYRMKLTGSVIMEENSAYMYAYDGGNTQAQTLLSVTGSANSSNTTSSTDIGSITSSGRYMTLRFKSDGSQNYAGLDLTVTLEKITYTITRKSVAGGTLDSKDADTLGAEIFLTGSPSSSYHLSDVRVVDKDGNVVKSSIYAFDRSKFTLPASNVTVTPTWTNNLTAEGGLHLDLLKNGKIDASIPAGIKSFSLYDNGGENGNYEDNSNDTLTLTAPEGFYLKVTGSTALDKGGDSLYIFDGVNTSASKLFGSSNTVAGAVANMTKAVVSAGRSLTFRFKSDDRANYSGLNLKVSVEPIAYGITIAEADNGSMSSDKDKAAEDSIVNLSWSSASGYLIKDIDIRDASDNKVVVNGGWYSGNEASFTMPASNVVVTPSYTNVLTADGGLYIHMARHVKTEASIPTSVKSFKVYASTAKKTKDEKSSDTLVLRSSERYRIHLSGGIPEVMGYDTLYVFDGCSTAADTLYKGFNRAGGSLIDIGSILSSGNCLTLNFRSNAPALDRALDLTVALKKSVRTLTIDKIPSQTYSGSAIKPRVSVKDGSTLLMNITDYTVSYSNNVNSGLARVTITGKGAYVGDTTLTFAIGPKVTQYAAINILEDQRGKGVAIDGNYNGDETIMITDSIEVDYVDYSRKFSTSGFSTIVLPFDVNTSNVSGLEKVAAFSEIKTNDAGRLVAVMSLVWKDSVGVPDTTLKANTPYMVLMNDGKFAVDGGVTLVPTVEPVVRSGTWEFRGTLAKRVWAEGDADLGHVYGFAAEERPDQNIRIGQFVKAGAGAWIRPGRAYLINVPETQQNHVGAGRPAIAALPSVVLPEDMDVVIEEQDGSTTFVGRFNARTGEFVKMKARTYDLKGRNVNGLSRNKGMFIRK